MRMLGAVDESQNAQADEAYDFLVGETVKVNFGPFSGFTGTIREVNQDRRKIKVEVKIFGRPTDLELENTQVERV